MKHVIPARKKLTALALTQPKETLPVGDFAKVIVIDKMFDVKIKYCVELCELTEKKNFN